ncbi:hypothetical protein KJZ63_00100 [Patescibacteria group bacterium]|nr:hypothetical protein [Patescibacteria group bacterium]
MSRLIEASRQKITGSENLGPTKELGFNPESFLPHRTAKVETCAPLCQQVLSGVDGVAAQKFIWEGADLDTARQEALKKLISESRRIEKSFLGWDMVRRDGGATGFEGYGAGYFPNAVDMAEAIAKLGAGMLAETKRNRAKVGDFTFMNRLWKFVGEGVYDPKIAEYMYTTLASTIARLKAETHSDGPVDHVRQTVSKLATSLTPIKYEPQATKKALGQTYLLPEPTIVQEQLAKVIPTEVVSPQTFAGRPEYWGYLFMLKLGMFGHPLVRTALHQELLSISR